MTHGGAATLRSPVLPYTFVMATKECERDMILRGPPNAMHLLTVIDLRFGGQLLVPSGVASLHRTAARGPSLFAGVFMSTGNVGSRPSSVSHPPPSDLI